MNNIFKTIKSLIKFSKLTKMKRKFVFFSEGSNYNNVFENIILKLIENKNYVTYISSDNKDKLLYLDNKYIETFYISKTIGQILLLNNINCENLFMTMPDLGNFHIKKSKFCNNYIYLFHSPVSTNMIYRNRAFANYDTIFCVGEHHYLELVEYKNKFKLNNQKLIKFGYPKFDDLFKKYSESNTHFIKNKISIAPSWGKKNLINQLDEKFYEKILSNDCLLNLRPHSNIQAKDNEILRIIKKKYLNNKNFIIETSNENFHQVFNSEFLITDWSGIGLEFAFITERPVIFIDTEKKINNEKFNDISQTPIEVSIRDKIGVIIKPEDIHKIDYYLKELKNNENNFRENIKKARIKYVYNLGSSINNLINFNPFSSS